MPDAIRPNHYKSGGLQPIEIMKAKMTHEQYCGFLLGNVIKYTLRFQDKNGVEDLRKARQYLDWLIDEQPVPVEEMFKTPMTQQLEPVVVGLDDTCCPICGALTGNLSYHVWNVHHTSVKYKDTP